VSSKTLQITETKIVDRPVSEVFAYVYDLINCEEWDPGVLRCLRLNPGPVGVGARYSVDCALPVGKLNLEYEVLDYQVDKVVVLASKSAIMDVLDTISVRQVEAGCELVYTAVFTFGEVSGWFLPAVQSGLQRMGYRAVQEGLKTALGDNFPVPVVTDPANRKESIVHRLSGFTRLGYKRGKADWSPISAYMADKHVLITGATSGLGKSAAKSLLRQGAQVTVVVRDEQRGGALIKELAAETGNARIKLAVADLSILADVDQLVKKLRQDDVAIDVLINNAGALMNPRQETAEGLEASFALLLLSPYLLTEGLLPLLQKAPAGRVINVVSGGMYTQKLRVNDLQSERGKYSGSAAYARAKRGLMILTELWSQQWQDSNVVVNAMHPGWADTPGVRSALPVFYRFTKPVLRSAEEGADTIVWLAAATEAARVSGELFLDRQIQPKYLFDKSREQDSDRALLVNQLAAWRERLYGVESRRKAG
jgi:dehydrogenase/reductase SDR family protein 12